MREREYLRQRYLAILSSIGGILIFASIIILSPLIMLVFYPDEIMNVFAFLIPSICLFSIGLILWLCFRSYPSSVLSIQEGGIIVVFSWIIVIICSALPFIFLQKLDFSQALFESVSGWTTTGLSILDMTNTSRMILFWRSVMQLSGGAGLAIIMMSTILGPSGVGLSTAEGRSEQLVPQVRQSSRLVLFIYITYAIIGIFLYWLVGMSPFDAINHSFTAVSTGGFSTQVESIGHWNSIAVEAVTLPLMLLGNLSFVTAWFLWRGKFQFVKRNGEIKLIAILIPISTAILFIFTCQKLYPIITKSIRVAIFETVSAITTTGFSTVSYSNWNGISIMTLIIMMLIGGGTCSTAGGIKQYRIYLLWKSLVLEIKRTFLPKTAVIELTAWEGDRKIYADDRRLNQISLFVFLYLLTYSIGVMLLCASGYSIQNSLFEMASSIGTVGLSVGVTAANMPKVALWTEILTMFLGRLEFIVVIVSLIKLGIDGKRMVR